MKRLEGIQYEPWWYEARLGIPTVSRFDDFITPAKGDYSKSAIRYIARLIREQHSGPVEGYMNAAMMHGITTEDEARSWYEFENDCVVEQIGLILNKGAGWSPDGLVGTGAIEIKCPAEDTHIMYLLNGGLPPEYKPQCHGAILVGELEWLDFMSYCPGYPTFVVRIVPDDYTVKVGVALEKFLTEHKNALAIFNKLA